MSRARSVATSTEGEADLTSSRGTELQRRRLTRSCRVTEEELPIVPQSCAPLTRRSVVYIAAWNVLMALVPFSLLLFGPDGETARALAWTSFALGFFLLSVQAVGWAGAAGVCGESLRVRPLTRYDSEEGHYDSGRWWFAVMCLAMCTWAAQIALVAVTAELSCASWGAIGSCGGEWSEWHEAYGHLPPLQGTNCACHPLDNGADCAAPRPLTCEGAPRETRLVEAWHVATPTGDAPTCTRAFAHVEAPPATAVSLLFSVRCSSVSNQGGELIVYTVDKGVDLCEVGGCLGDAAARDLTTTAGATEVARTACGQERRESFFAPANRSLIFSFIDLVSPRLDEPISVDVESFACRLPIPSDENGCLPFLDSVPPEESGEREREEEEERGGGDKACDPLAGLVGNEACVGEPAVNCSNVAVSWGRECRAVRSGVPTLDAACSPAGRCVRGGRDEEGEEASVCAAVYGREGGEEETRRVIRWLAWWGMRRVWESQP